MDPLLEKYLLSKKKKQTQNRVATTLNHYIHCQDMTPSELLQEAWKEQRGETPPWMHRLPERLKEFKEYLEDQGYSELTVRNGITTVRSFYKQHGIHPPPQRLEYRVTDTIGRVARSVEDLPGRDDIIRAVGNSNIKYRALIMVMATSGMDVSTALNHNVQNFIDGLGDNAETHMDDLLDVAETRHLLTKSNEPIIKWRAHRSKTTRDPLNPHYYTTYSTPEAIHRVLDYLESNPPSTAADPLWRVGPTHRPLNPLSVQDYLRTLNSRCGWKKQGRMIYFRSHNLRKWFANQLQASGMKYRNIEHLLDHTVGGQVHQAYFKIDQEDLKLEYLRYMGALSLEAEVEVLSITTKDRQRLEELEEKDQAKEERIRHLERYITDLERDKKF